MNYPTTARAAYMGNSVTTASPARLLVMLVERLVLDVERGLRAQLEEDWAEAHRQLVHAQDIVIELENTLDVEAMPGGQELAALYDYLRRLLVAANIRRSPGGAKQALVIARHLCDTWRQAAMAAVDS